MSFNGNKNGGSEQTSFIDMTGPSLALEAPPIHEVKILALATMLESICDFVRQFVAFQSEAEPIVLALWIAHAWALNAFHYTPYLHIVSPEKRCGKTRLVDCLALLSPKPWQVVSPTAAVLFRKIEADESTLFLDEVDSIFFDGKNGNQPLRAMLNSGFERGAKVPRCDGRHGLTHFRVFCPKALAGIGKLPDTINDRCIRVRLVRRAREESVERFRKRDAEIAAAPIRDQLAQWARSEETINNLRTACPEIPEELGDRQADICEPLFAIADLAGGDWPERSRGALVTLCVAQGTEDESLGIKLLSAIRDAFDEGGADRLPTQQLLRKLVARETDEPWAEWWEHRLQNHNTRGPAAKLASLLKPYGIQPRGIRLRDDKTPRGYMREDFAEAWKRFCPARTPSGCNDAT